MLDIFVFTVFLYILAMISRGNKNHNRRAGGRNRRSTSSLTQNENIARPETTSSFVIAFNCFFINFILFLYIIYLFCFFLLIGV